MQNGGIIIILYILEVTIRSVTVNLPSKKTVIRDIFKYYKPVYSLNTTCKKYSTSTS